MCGYATYAVTPLVSVSDRWKFSRKEINEDWNPIIPDWEKLRKNPCMGVTILLHLKQSVLDSFQIESNLIIESVFLLIINQTEVCFVHKKRKTNQN